MSDGDGGIRFDPEAIRALANILSDTGLTEIEIAEKDSRIRVARQPAPVTTFIGAGPASMGPMPAPGVPQAPTSPGAMLPDEDASHPGAVTSPMVGVVYLSPEPGAPPYVTPGQQVSAGQTVLLIEAMKTFNQIKAPKAGTVARILVASGAPVEYGEVLLVVE
ncbi:MAG TPA: acetyl-CoA carboxylase biotin carboxyl carrier protein subunit [Acidisphaera sp.]|nr:acetyl-CoA carboxylase biotin carboxyl carrier protein subunit [Acidisphaera sp.]